MKRWDTWLAIVFFALTIWLLWDKLTALDWAQVGAGLVGTPKAVLLLTVLMSVASYTIFCAFDFLGLRKSGRRIRRRTAWTAAFVCYASNFNLGAIIGGLGMRLKVYSDLGVEKVQIGRVMALSTLSNWAGYTLFGGLFFLLFPPSLPEAYGLDDVPWRAVGIVGIALSVVYLWFVMHGRDAITMFGHVIPLPSAREGWIRLGLGVLNWTTVSVLLVGLFSWHRDAPMALVVSAYLVSAIAGVLTHIPGGLGVTESVFLATLGPVIGDTETMSGILTFRAIYYLLPLILGVPGLIWLKLRLAPREKAAKPGRPVPREQAL